eukprot:gene3216-6359_t
MKTMQFSFTVFVLLLSIAGLAHGRTSTSPVDISVNSKSGISKGKLSSLNEFTVSTRPTEKRVLVADATKPTEKFYWYMQILPIYPKELLKFFSLSMMMFWIVFVFTMTRDTKDTLIVTNCGAEAIAFLKVYGVVPAAAGFMILYAKLANTLAPKTLFYVTLAPFFVFYSLFAFVLYPMRNILHPLHIAVPKGGLSYAVNLFRFWTYSLYYIVSEVWGSAGIPLLFWSCANDVVPINQAKRIYPLMSLIGNLGPILSGVTMTLVSKAVSRRIHNEDDAFELSLKILTGCMTIAGGLVAALHWFVHKQKKKAKLSFAESMRVLSSDPYLRNIATMVLSYGLTMEFTEIIWKASVKKAFPIKTDYMGFMGKYSAMVGSASFVMMLVGARIVNFGWRVGALMTPAMMALLAVPFFGFITFGGTSSHKALLIAVYIGLVQNVFSKATKYAIFDPTKEMTYIPLDVDAKTKGKAAIDVLGARLGKSGGALSQQLLVVAFGSIMNGAPVLAILFYAVIFAWIGAVNKLAPMFKQRTEEMEDSGGRRHIGGCPLVERTSGNAAPNAILTTEQVTEEAQAKSKNLPGEIKPSYQWIRGKRTGP